MDDRSERLRKRRKQSTEQPTSRSPRETDTGDTSSEPSKPEHDGDEQDTGGQEDDQREAPIKEKQTGTYMYLPETQVKDLKRQYNVLKAEYEFEYDEEFEKNRHFYPLVIQYGLDGLDGLDTSEIRARLEAFYE